MKGIILLFLATTLGLALLAESREAYGHDPLSQVFSGDGSVRAHRLPWLDGSSVLLTQGWNSPPEGTHEGQFATDWAKAGGGSFAVHAVTEGQAVCIENDGGAGNHVDLTRSGGKVEKYMHLLECPFPEGTTKHFEQGDLLGSAGETGCPGCGIHLHFEVFSAGQSVSHSLSQFFDFDDRTVHRNCSNGDPCHHHHTFRSDNAGPGQGAGNALIGAGMNQMYRDIGHFFCGLNQAWNCLGSSWSPPKAGSLTFYNEVGWWQDFKGPSSAPAYLGQTAINWSTSCNKAYFLPKGNWEAWLNYAAQLGNARSDVYQNPSLGGFAQNFRGGYLVSATYGGPATFLSGTNTTCQ